MQTMTIPQFHNLIKSQGVARDDVAFICPVCATVQSARDLIAAGAGTSFDEVGKYLGFSCIGRFTDAGPHKSGASPGRGCNWTLGGLLHVHTLEVIDHNGKRQPHFHVATPEQAQSHCGKDVR